MTSTGFENAVQDEIGMVCLGKDVGDVLTASWQ